jgi:hypothetical protein
MSTRALAMGVGIRSLATAGGAQPYFLSPTGDDKETGPRETPLATLRRARAGLHRDAVVGRVDGRGISDTAALLSRAAASPTGRWRIGVLRDQPPVTLELIP